MTIDEAIAHARGSAKNERKIFDKCNPKNNYACKLCIKTRTCLERAEEHEQLAEWLEELKCYKNDNDFSDYADRFHKIAFNSGYNNAIDDFVQKVKEHQYVLFDVINSKYYGMFTIGIEQIAEQLKEGGNNE